MGNGRRTGSETRTASAKYQKKAFYFTGKTGFYEWSELWFDQEI